MMLPIVSPRRALRRSLAAVLLVALGACGTAEAVVVPVAPPPVPTPGAIALLDRLAEAKGLPAVEGLEVGEARARLEAAGAQVQVVAFDPSPIVRAQYPAAGTPLPSDGLVIVWTGVPPALPPPPPPPPAPPAEVEVEAPAEAPPPAPAPAPAPPPVVESNEVAQTVQAAPPAPPRTSPRVRPATEAGTVLEGPASWYGPGFEGRGTACGQVFDPTQLTLASRELRCGTVVRITGPSGAQVDATVTDWGPAEWTNRRFDLSQATFAAIAHPGTGVVPVTVEVL